MVPFCLDEQVRGSHRNGRSDPTKVVRLALENAASVAGVLLLTEAT
jgi:chaperonin GroEL (HSP60 family)